MVIFLSALCLISACQKEELPAQAPPPVEVDILTTKAEDVPIFQTYVGQVYGAKDIAIRARGSGSASTRRSWLHFAAFNNDDRKFTAREGKDSDENKA